MNKERVKPLTLGEFTFFLIGFLLGPGFYQLPNLLVKDAKQDAWVAATISIIYPLYIIVISLYIINKHPKENLLSISRKNFGNVLGTLLNIIFLLQFLIELFTATSELIKLLRTYIVAFLTPLKVAVVSTALAFYLAKKGIKVLGKVNEFISYGALLVLALSAFTLSKGSMLNVQPVFGSGITNILKSSVITSYYYMGFEVILLYHPYVKDEKTVKKASFLALTITSITWIWITFITTYYLGIHFISVSLWAFVFVFESLNVPIINNFLVVFMTAWSFMGLKFLSNCYFTNAYMLNDILKISLNKLYVILYPLVIVFSVIFLDASIRKNILEVSSPIFILFNMIFYTAIAIVSSIKRKSNN